MRAPPNDRLQLMLFFLTVSYYLSIYNNSNSRTEVREELRGQDHSFTEIAKLVGERWQVLSPDIRDACERQAAAAKEKYYNELSEYKKTPQYSQYQQYLADFKLKHAAPRSGKRRKLSNLTLSFDIDLSPEGKRSRIETEPPGEATPSTSSSGHDKLAERQTVPESSAAGHLRSLSNPNTRQTPFSIGNYRVPSASTSPATYSVGMQSPITSHAHSPQSSPPTTAGVYSSYDLPHHARSGQSSAESRTRESTLAGYFPASTPAESRARESTSAGYFPAGSYSRWQSQSDEHSPHISDRSQFHSRRPPRSGSSIPSLVHTDTTHSSHSEVMPPTPYQGSLLPPLDAPKGDRTLPPPVPSSTAGSLTSPLDPRPILPPPPSNYPLQPASQDLDDGSQWPALLRATQLAHDADMKIEESKQQAPP
jgi:hypothetical protein